VADVDNKTGQLRKVEKIFEEFNTDFHEATLTFSKDEKTVYLTRNYSENKKLKANRNGVSHMQIVKGSVIKNALANVMPLAINDKKHSFGHPALSEDGKYLFFVSDMPGGYGASDIYVTKLLPNGDTGEPINLGSTINTAGREMFPYVNNDILYFASDGHYGLGGLDVYRSEIMPNNQYSIPLNLGAPINSSLDDFSFIVEEDNEFGYFASNRVGGMGDDDLYYFKNVTEDKYQVFSGVVLDDSSQEPIAFANIKIYDGNNKLISELISNDLGEFYIKQLREDAFKISFTKQGYNQHLYIMEPDEDRPKVSTGNKVYLASFDKYVEKDGDVEKLIVNPIFFESWKYNITPKAAVELDNIISTLNKFPDIRIKIESHTDSRGTDSFNLQLSGNRAKSTYKYLIANGISPDRIESAIGYGETRLKNYCVNGVNCSPDEHLINRRSDFIVVNK
jgi:outer membrane protein OmpA-like peptidoglycan-associated protein